MVGAFKALAHETRLGVFRLLIPAGAEGLAAGTIGERLPLAPNNLSFHLGRLANAGLIHGRRQGRHLYYSIDYAMLGALVGFLAEDCCADAPEGCLPSCPPSRGASAPLPDATEKRRRLPITKET